MNKKDSFKISQNFDSSSNSRPIQRTIEVVGESSFSGSDTSNSKSGASGTKAIYGIMAVLFIVVAIGAIYYLWQKKSD